MEETKNDKATVERVQESYQPAERKAYVPCSAQPTGDRPVFTPPQESGGVKPAAKPSSEGTGGGGGEGKT